MACHILPVTQTNTGRIQEGITYGSECQDAELTEDHFGDWPILHVFRKVEESMSILRRVREEI